MCFSPDSLLYAFALIIGGNEVRWASLYLLLESSTNRPPLPCLHPSPLGLSARFICPLVPPGKGSRARCTTAPRARCASLRSTCKCLVEKEKRVVILQRAARGGDRWLISPKAAEGINEFEDSSPELNENSQTLYWIIKKTDFSSLPIFTLVLNKFKKFSGISRAFFFFSNNFWTIYKSCC